MSRPVKLNDERKRMILQVIALGGSKKTAVAYAGISLRTLEYWLAKGRDGTRGIYVDFLHDFEKAKVAPDILAMGIVKRAVQDGDVSSAKWWLEKKMGWGRVEISPQVQIAVNTDNMSINQLMKEVKIASQQLEDLEPDIDLDEE